MTLAEGRREPGQWCECGHAKRVHGLQGFCNGGKWLSGDRSGVFIPCGCKGFVEAKEDEDDDA